MSDNITIINKLQQAKSDPERTWIVTELSLQKMSPDLKDAFLAAVIPHWFNPNILAALLPFGKTKAGKTKATKLYKSIINNFNYSERFNNVDYALQNLTRSAILWHLIHDRPNLLQTYSNCAWEYFKMFENSPEHEVEATYHLLITNSLIGLNRFKEQLADYEQKNNVSAVNTLRRNKDELVVELRLLSDNFFNSTIYKPFSIEGSKMHILHLSDIHLENKTQAQVYWTQLETDLNQELNIKRLEYLVIPVISPTVPQKTSTAQPLRCWIVWLNALT